MILKYLLMVWGGKTGTMKVLFLDKSLLCVQRHKALFEGRSYSSPAMSHAWKRWWAGFCCLFSLEIGHFLYSDIIQLEHINKHKYNLMAWTNWKKKLFWRLQLWKHYHKLFVSHLLRPLRKYSREEWVSTLYDNIVQNEQLLLFLFVFFKAEHSTRSENWNLDSCQLIKNNECSRGFNFLSSQSLVQSQSATRRAKSGWKTLCSSSAPASAWNLQTAIQQLIWQGNNPKRQLKILLLARWASIGKGARHTVDDGFVSVPSYSLSPFSLTHSHALT